MATAATPIANIFEAAADLIEPEGKWTQRADARDESGSDTEPYDNRARCWCVWGAISRVAGDAAEETAISAFRRHLLMTEATSLISSWNDAPERTQAEVVAKLREAAAKAREQAA